MSVILENIFHNFQVFSVSMLSMIIICYFLRYLSVIIPFLNSSQNSHFDVEAADKCKSALNICSALYSLFLNSVHYSSYQYCQQRCLSSAQTAFGCARDSQFAAEQWYGCCCTLSANRWPIQNSGLVQPKESC